jgi:hypothetical protein
MKNLSGIQLILRAGRGRGDMKRNLTICLMDIIENIAQAENSFEVNKKERLGY